MADWRTRTGQGGAPRAEDPALAGTPERDAGMTEETNTDMAPELSGTVRLSLQRLWRSIRERGGSDLDTPPAALPGPCEPTAEKDQPSAERLRREVSGVLQRSSHHTAWRDCSRLERCLGELVDEEPDMEQCVSTLHETGFIDAAKAAFYAEWIEKAQKDPVARRIMLGRMANDLQWGYAPGEARPAS